VEKDFRAARKTHPALLVGGLRALIRRWEAAGVEVAEDQPLEAFQRVYVYAPFWS
jgi:hypothetical protein